MIKNMSNDAAAQWAGSDAHARYVNNQCGNYGDNDDTRFYVSYRGYNDVISESFTPRSRPLKKDDYCLHMSKIWQLYAGSEPFTLDDLDDFMDWIGEHPDDLHYSVAELLTHGFDPRYPDFDFLDDIKDEVSTDELNDFVTYIEGQLSTTVVKKSISKEDEKSLKEFIANHRQS